MRKWLFLCGFLCICIFGFQVFRDYQEYKEYRVRIDAVIMEASSDHYIPELSEQNIALAKIIYRNENRLFPNFWQDWYLWRKLSILPILQQHDRHSEMLLLSDKIYKITHQPFYLWTYCLLLERIENTDLTCYQNALIELKKQDNYFSRGEYWLIAAAVNDPDLEKNKSRLSNSERELMDYLIQDRKKTLREMFP